MEGYQSRISQMDKHLQEDCCIISLISISRETTRNTGTPNQSWTLCHSFQFVIKLCCGVSEEASSIYTPLLLHLLLYKDY